MELKSLEDWVLEKQFKSVPNVVDVSQLWRHHARVSGADRSRQAGRLRAQHRRRWSSSWPNNNVNAGGSFVEAGMQQINVRALGLVKNVQRHRRDRDQERRTARRSG